VSCVCCKQFKRGVSYVKQPVIFQVLTEKMMKVLNTQTGGYDCESPSTPTAPVFTCIFEITNQNINEDKPTKFQGLYGEYDDNSLSKIPSDWRMKSVISCNDKHLDTKDFDLILSHNLRVVERRIGKGDPNYHVSIVEREKIQTVAQLTSKKRMLRYVNGITKRKLTNQDLVVFAELKAKKTTYDTNFITCCFNDITFTDETKYKYVSIKRTLAEQDEETADYSEMLNQVYSTLDLKLGRHAIVEWFRLHDSSIYVCIYRAVGEYYFEEEQEKEAQMLEQAGEYMNRFFFKKGDYHIK
jgi:hypothetical protein